MQLIHGEAIEEMSKLPSQSVDLILADPPYGTTACKWDTVIPLAEMWHQLNRIIKPKGAIVLTASQPFTSVLVSSNLQGFKFCWVWDKVRGTGFQIVKHKPMVNHEDIAVFSARGKAINYYPQMREREKPRVSKNKGTTRQMLVSGGQEYKAEKALDKKYPVTILTFSNDNQKDKIHPTQKPVALMEYLIKTYSLEGETVLDFTMGSGTTGVACKNLNRDFIGIELEEDYFQLAKERIESA